MATVSQSIAFANLRAEMGRSGCTIADIAKTIGVTRDTARNKLSRKTPIMLDEAIAIQRARFSDCDVRYLFSEIWDECRINDTRGSDRK